MPRPAAVRRVLSGLLAMAAAAPLAAAADGRIFEMRTYIAAPGKLEALSARFRNHTMGLFKKHGMEVVGFWQPVEQDAAAEKLVYVLAFKDRAAADAAWKAFTTDPAWLAVKAESEKDGPILAKLERVFLSPTDY